MIHWRARIGRDADREKAKALEQALDISPACAALLCARGYGDAQAAYVFMHPEQGTLHDPLALQDMEKAVKRLGQAIDGGERIVIYGDYDADGMCATALMMRGLRTLGGNVEYYIPSRDKEGYGMNASAIRTIAAGGPGLIVSVDNGITAAPEIALANELGLHCIVTDHHICPEELPPALAVIDPHRADERYPFSDLCGTAVAGKLLGALGGEEMLDEMIDLIALATVADLVPLHGENRILVYRGLKKINQAPSLGIQMLARAAGLDGKTLSAGNLAFGLAPRLNAAGRIDSPAKGVELLMAQQPERAWALAAELDGLNQKRQQMEMTFSAQAEKMVLADEKAAQKGVILLQHPDWHEGVIGIVASRMVERFHRPAILFAVKEGRLVGSARSVPGINIYELMAPCRELFMRFGGHAQAAGVTLAPENFTPFAEKINALAAQLSPELFQRSYEYDLKIALPQVSEQLIGEMEHLSPFGWGNPEPAFLLEDERVEQAQAFGKENRHLKMRLGGRLPAIAWQAGERQRELERMGRATLLVVPEINTYGGRWELRCQVKAFAPQANARSALASGENTALKFVRAILGAIRYNMDKPGAGAIREYPFEQGTAGLALAAAGSPFGSLAVCYTPKGAALLLEALEKAGALQRFEVYEGAPPAEPYGENAIVLAPLPEFFTLNGRWQRLVLAEGAALGGGLVFDTCQTEALRHDQPQELVRDALKDLVPDRAALGQCWKRISALPRHEIEAMPFAQLCACCGYAGAQEQLYFALEVFNELGLLHFTCARDWMVHIKLPQQAARRNLEDSGLFCAVRALLQEPDVQAAHVS